MKPYLSIPVESARQIAREFDKQMVVILAWNTEHELLHTVTYGQEPSDKIGAACAGERCAVAFGVDLEKAKYTEDFRTLDAARNAQVRDLADGILNALRSYEHGNSSPSLAKTFADKLQSIIKNPA